MNILSTIIQGMNKEEIRFYKIYTNRIQTDAEKKDVLLFDLIRSQADAFDDHNAANALYGKSDKNSYYRLKNRLLTEVGKSLAIQYLDEDEHKISFYFILYRLMVQKNNQLAAQYYIKQCEKLALTFEKLQWLDVIYTEMIQFSLSDIDINPIDYIQKRSDNYEKLRKQKDMDQVLAAVTYEIKVTQNYSRRKKDIFEHLEKMLKQFSNDASLLNDATFRLKLYRAICLSLLQKEEYQALLQFTEKAYNEALRDKIFNKNNHDQKLQLLTYIVNAYFKLKEYDKSLLYATRLHKAMNEHKQMLYSKYEFFYLNALVINYSVVNIKKAIDVLIQMQQNIDPNKMQFYDVFIFINLALCYYKQEQYDHAIKQLIRVQTFEIFNSADEYLRLKVEIAELIIRLEMDDNDIIQYRIQQIHRSYKKLLQDDVVKREKYVLQLLVLMLKSINIKKDNKISKMCKFVESLPIDSEEIIDYNEWMKKKVTPIKP